MENKKSRTALLVMDMQQILLQSLPDYESVVENVGMAIRHARKENITVIYIVVGFREGFPEVHPRNKRFGKIVNQMPNIETEKWMEIAPSVKPLPNEPIVVKKRFSAFAGSDLELVLRSKEIEHVVLCGIVTSGVVLSTLTEASDKDYKITVLFDACKDRDEEVHRVLMTKVFPGAADVTNVDEWVS